MNLQAYNQFCNQLTATEHYVQWRGSHVWKVGGKVFAIAQQAESTDLLSVTFKVTPLSYDILSEQAGLRPAPYLASRGMKWIQHYDRFGLSDEDLKRYLQTSHRLVAEGLSIRKRGELGLLDP